ncbi:V8-like Glu-specific endopeptidase [Geodermatophilus dictyosporus]|uniref:V8-like Glu-specific endopeptidase n=1 Tax=Geodermatophilus dictyosporus TaxID=1523247 RepID=A0A1I5TRH9_9ACTN|nr:serine protease [Geodermatophilus dictyosporus]SFP85650.1 V8-like Glu-specific endopeptidase [Geodermatophilus dictyosporus]
MISGLVFSDGALREEFLDRFSQLAEAAQAQLDGLERLEGGLTVDDAQEVAVGIDEGTYRLGDRPGLEAIIERFTRPVHLVQRGTFTDPPDAFPDSEEIGRRLEQARALLDQAIPSVGRIDVRNHRLDWLGTGWMVAPDLVVTNRHVAAEFAHMKDGAFVFRQYSGLPPVRVDVDWRHEHRIPEESRFRIEEVLWIEPENSVDVAVLRVAEHSYENEPRPRAIELASRVEFEQARVGAWVAVVGYPAYDSRNDAADQQRIFDGIYNYKRLAPGQVTALVQQDLLHHDATTLGGNSGSVLIDLASGKAFGLHFGGIEGDRNFAVQAPRLRQILDQLS